MKSHEVHHPLCPEGTFLTHHHLIVFLKNLIICVICAWVCFGREVLCNQNVEEAHDSCARLRAALIRSHNQSLPILYFTEIQKLGEIAKEPMSQDDNRANSINPRIQQTEFN